jgi:hypothetical protein
MASLVTWGQSVGDNIVSYSPFTVGKEAQCIELSLCQEVIASKIFYFCKIDGKKNPSNVLPKFLPYAVFWPLVQLFLFW